MTRKKQHGSVQAERISDREKQGLFFSWSTKLDYANVFMSHFPPAALAGIVLLTAALFPFESFPDIPCPFCRLFGLPCPFCGFTRSFRAMAAGDPGLALGNCPLACLLYVVTMLVFAFNTAGLITGIRLYPAKQITTVRPGTIFLGFILLAINWNYRILTGLT